MYLTPLDKHNTPLSVEVIFSLGLVRHQIECTVLDNSISHWLITWVIWGLTLSLTRTLHLTSQFLSIQLRQAIRNSKIKSQQNWKGKPNIASRKMCFIMTRTLWRARWIDAQKLQKINLSMDFTLKSLPNSKFYHIQTRDLNSYWLS